MLLSLAATGVPVATFMDTGVPGPTSAYTAVISWGDNSTSNDTQILSQGTPNGVVFTVYGNHTYAEEGTYSISVTITKTASGATAIASGQAVIADAAADGRHIRQLHAEFRRRSVQQAGRQLHGRQYLRAGHGLHRHDQLGRRVAGHHGDDRRGHARGDLQRRGDPYLHHGRHIAITTVVKDVGGSTVTLTGTATVSDRALIAAATMPVSAVENTSTGSVVLATFTDPNPLDTGSGVSATVSWGDGTGTLPAVVTFIGTSPSGSMFQVSGTHTYTTPGTDTISITVTTTGGATTSPSPLTTTADVADAPITASGTSITGDEGISTGNVVIATFTDADPDSTVANFTTGNGSVKVNWGDGSALQTLSASAITASGSPNGVLFTVTAAHTYDDAGDYQVTVTITDTDGATASANGGASIGDAALSPGTAVALNEHTGALLSGIVVGSFTDANTSAPVTDFTSTIDWGDGSPNDAGTIVAGSSGGRFNVEGTHAYAKAGSYRSPSWSTTWTARPSL